MNEDNKQTTEKKNLKASNHDDYFTYSLLALLIPIVGIIVGASYMTKEKPLDKKLGENMISFSVLGMIIGGLLYFTFIGNQMNALYL